MRKTIEQWLGAKSMAWKSRACLALISLSMVIAYAPLRHAGYVQFDDQRHVTDNEMVKKGLSVETVSWAFRYDPEFGAYWPLTMLSHMVVCEFFGISPLAHHLANIVLHWLAVCTVFAVMRRMTGRLFPAMLLAWWFAVHPLHVEPVAWIAGRKDVLCGLFWWLAIGGYWLYVTRGGWYRYGLALLFFAASLMSKTTAAPFPVVLLLLDYWPLRRLAWPGCRNRGVVGATKSTEGTQDIEVTNGGESRGGGAGP